MTEWSVCMRAAEELLHCRNSPGPLKLSLLRRRINKRRPRASFFFLPSSSLSLSLSPSIVSLTRSDSFSAHRPRDILFPLLAVGYHFPRPLTQEQENKKQFERSTWNVDQHPGDTRGRRLPPPLNFGERRKFPFLSRQTLFLGVLRVCPIKADWVAWIDQ